MTTSRRPALSSVLRGLRGRCPACGEGRLFDGYLRQAPSCSHCGEPIGYIRAEDGPPWFISLPALGIGAVGAVLVLLPRVKGAFIGLLWRMQKSG